jgi:hypothetical protein
MNLMIILQNLRPTILTPTNYFGNLIEQKNSMVRLLEDMMSSKCQSTKTDTYVGDD